MYDYMCLFVLVNVRVSMCLYVFACSLYVFVRVRACSYVSRTDCMSARFIYLCLYVFEFLCSC